MQHLYLLPLFGEVFCLGTPRHRTGSNTDVLALVPVEQILTPRDLALP